MNNGAFAYKQNHGWRTIGIQERADAIIWLNEFKPQNKEESRAKAILELFLRENYSAQAIVRMNHPDIVSIGNRNNGQPLTTVSILRIIYQYFPQFKGRHEGNKQKDSTKKRVALMRKREKEKSPHIQMCAHCGSKKELEEHHMIPLFMGGANDDENLVFLCKSCHRIVTEYQMRMFNGRKEGEGHDR